MPTSRIYQASGADIARRWTAGDPHERARIDAVLERQNAQIRQWTNATKD